MRGLKQSHAAALLGVSQATVSRWETGALEPSESAREALAGLMAPHASADQALKRLVENAPFPVHLICDLTHALLAASAARVTSWRRSASEAVGESLWRYASEEIQAAEARLADLGWDEAAPPAVVFWTGANRDETVPIAPGLTLWERLLLADGRSARLVTTVAALPPHARLVEGLCA